MKSAWAFGPYNQTPEYNPTGGSITIAAGHALRIVGRECPIGWGFAPRVADTVARRTARTPRAAAGAFAPDKSVLL